MIEDFHKRYLTKHFALHEMSVFAGFRDGDEACLVTPHQVERSPDLRLGAIRDLLDGGYIIDVGDDDYEVTPKAYDESPMEEYIGKLRVGSGNKPLAVWLSGPVLKAALEDLEVGDALIKEDGKGGKFVVAMVDDRTEFQIDADEYLYDNFREVCETLTDLSKVTLENLALGEMASFVGLDKHVAELMDEHAKEIERRKRKYDALSALSYMIENGRHGSWEAFIAQGYALARDKQQS